MDDSLRTRLIGAYSNALYESLRAFAPPERLWILAEVNARVVRRLRTGVSSQYALDFSQDEPPTKPENLPPAPIQGAPAIETSKRPGGTLGPTETTLIDVEALEALRKKTTKP